MCQCSINFFLLRWRLARLNSPTVLAVVSGGLAAFRDYERQCPGRKHADHEADAAHEKHVRTRKRQRRVAKRKADDVVEQQSDDRGPSAHAANCERQFASAGSAVRSRSASAAMPQSVSAVKNHGCKKVPRRRRSRFG